MYSANLKEAQAPKEREASDFLTAKLNIMEPKKNLFEQDGGAQRMDDIKSLIKRAPPRKRGGKRVSTARSTPMMRRQSAGYTPVPGYVSPQSPRPDMSTSPRHGAESTRDVGFESVRSNTSAISSEFIPAYMAKLQQADTGPSMSVQLESALGDAESTWRDQLRDTNEKYASEASVRASQTADILKMHREFSDKFVQVVAT